MVTFYFTMLGFKLILPTFQIAGNIRVYCRIKPAFRVESKNVVDFIGEDGSLFILDPSKTYGRKSFQFNRIFGPTASQGRVLKAK